MKKRTAVPIFVEWVRQSFLKEVYSAALLLSASSAAELSVLSLSSEAASEDSSASEDSLEASSLETSSEAASLEASSETASLDTAAEEAALDSDEALEPHAVAATTTAIRAAEANNTFFFIKIFPPRAKKTGSRHSFGQCMILKKINICAKYAHFPVQCAILTKKCE